MIGEIGGTPGSEEMSVEVFKLGLTGYVHLGKVMTKVILECA